MINGLIYAAEGDKLNAVISLACGIPVVGNFIAGVARCTKAVKIISATAKIADACKTVGRIGNAAASAKALYDTYQEARTKCETTGGMIAYIGGTVAAGYLMGRAAKWGADKLKNLASKAMPKFKTALQEAAGKFVSKISNGIASFGSKKGKQLTGTEIVPYYPLNGGAIPGTEKITYLMAGDKIDRYGKLDGEYFSPINTPLEMRALPYNADLSQYRQFEVVKPFEVEESIIAPAFDNIGLGKQYHSKVKATTLLKKGIIKQIGDD